MQHQWGAVGLAVHASYTARQVGKFLGRTQPCSYFNVENLKSTDSNISYLILTTVGV